MKLFRVKVSADFVMASNAENFPSEFDVCSVTKVVIGQGSSDDVDVDVSKVASLDDLPPTWNGAEIPWGDSNPGEMTCSEILGLGADKIINRLFEGGLISDAERKLLLDR